MSSDPGSVSDVLARMFPSQATRQPANDRSADDAELWRLVDDPPRRDRQAERARSIAESEGAFYLPPMTARPIHPVRNPVSPTRPPALSIPANRQVRYTDDELADQITRQTVRDAETGCLNWTGKTFERDGRTTRSGGHTPKINVLRVGGEEWKSVRRLLYEQTFGPINDENKSVGHRGRSNPLCTRPDHGKLLNRSDSLANARKARQKLSSAQVQEVLRRSAGGENQTRLAKVFGVSRPRINQLVRGVNLAGVSQRKKVDHHHSSNDLGID
jgi:predicted XRE-type DNA-binding protein